MVDIFTESNLAGLVAHKATLSESAQDDDETEAMRLCEVLLSLVRGQLADANLHDSERRAAARSSLYKVVERYLIVAADARDKWDVVDVDTHVADVEAQLEAVSAMAAAGIRMEARPDDFDAEVLADHVDWLRQDLQRLQRLARSGAMTQLEDLIAKEAAAAADPNTSPADRAAVQDQLLAVLEAAAADPAARPTSRATLDEKRVAIVAAREALTAEYGIPPRGPVSPIGPTATLLAAIRASSRPTTPAIDLRRGSLAPAFPVPGSRRGSVGHAVAPAARSVGAAGARTIAVVAGEADVPPDAVGASEAPVGAETDATAAGGVPEAVETNDESHHMSPAMGDEAALGTPALSPDEAEGVDASGTTPRVPGADGTHNSEAEGDLAGGAAEGDLAGGAAEGDLAGGAAEGDLAGSAPIDAADDFDHRGMPVAAPVREDARTSRVGRDRVQGQDPSPKGAHASPRGRPGSGRPRSPRRSTQKKSRRPSSRGKRPRSESAVRGPSVFDAPSEGVLSVIPRVVRPASALLKARSGATLPALSAPLQSLRDLTSPVCYVMGPKGEETVTSVVGMDPDLPELAQYATDDDPVDPTLRALVRYCRAAAASRDTGPQPTSGKRFEPTEGEALGRALISLRRAHLSVASVAADRLHEAFLTVVRRGWENAWGILHGRDLWTGSVTSLTDNLAVQCEALHAIVDGALPLSATALASVESYLTDVSKVLVKARRRRAVLLKNDPMLMVHEEMEQLSAAAERDDPLHGTMTLHRQVFGVLQEILSYGILTPTNYKLVVEKRTELLNALSARRQRAVTAADITRGSYPALHVATLQGLRRRLHDAGQGRPRAVRQVETDHERCLRLMCFLERRRFRFFDPHELDAEDTRTDRIAAFDGMWEGLAAMDYCYASGGNPFADLSRERLLEVLDQQLVSGTMLLRSPIRDTVCPSAREAGAVEHHLAVLRSAEQLLLATRPTESVAACSSDILYSGRPVPPPLSLRPLVEDLRVSRRALMVVRVDPAATTEDALDAAEATGAALARILDEEALTGAARRIAVAEARRITAVACWLGELLGCGVRRIPQDVPAGRVMRRAAVLRRARRRAGSSEDRPRVVSTGEWQEAPSDASGESISDASSSSEASNSDRANDASAPLAAVADVDRDDALVVAALSHPSRLPAASATAAVRDHGLTPRAADLLIDVALGRVDIDPADASDEAPDHGEPPDPADEADDPSDHDKPDVTDGTSAQELDSSVIEAQRERARQQRRDARLERVRARRVSRCGDTSTQENSDGLHHPGGAVVEVLGAVSADMVTSYSEAPPFVRLFEEAASAFLSGSVVIHQRLATRRLAVAEAADDFFTTVMQAGKTAQAVAQKYFVPPPPEVPVEDEPLEVPAQGEDTPAKDSSVEADPDEQAPAEPCNPPARLRVDLVQRNRLGAIWSMEESIPLMPQPGAEHGAALRVRWWLERRPQAPTSFGRRASELRRRSSTRPAEMAAAVAAVNEKKKRGLAEGAASSADRDLPSRRGSVAEPSSGKTVHDDPSTLPGHPLAREAVSYLATLRLDVLGIEGVANLLPTAAAVPIEARLRDVDGRVAPSPEQLEAVHARSFAVRVTFAAGEPPLDESLPAGGAAAAPDVPGSISPTDHAQPVPTDPKARLRAVERAAVLVAESQGCLRRGSATSTFARGSLSGHVVWPHPNQCQWDRGSPAVVARRDEVILEVFDDPEGLAAMQRHAHQERLKKAAAVRRKSVTQYPETDEADTGAREPGQTPADAQDAEPGEDNIPAPVVRNVGRAILPIGLRWRAAMLAEAAAEAEVRDAVMSAEEAAASAAAADARYEAAAAQRRADQEADEAAVTSASTAVHGTENVARLAWGKEETLPLRALNNEAAEGTVSLKWDLRPRVLRDRAMVEAAVEAELDGRPLPENPAALLGAEAKYAALRVKVLRGRNLRKADLLSGSDGYCEVELCPGAGATAGPKLGGIAAAAGGGRGGLARTPVVESQNPDWNHVIEWPHTARPIVAAENDELCVRIWDDDLIGRDPLGQATVPVGRRWQAALAAEEAADAAVRQLVHARRALETNNAARASADAADAAIRDGMRTASTEAQAALASARQQLVVARADMTEHRSPAPPPAPVATAVVDQDGAVAVAPQLSAPYPVLAAEPEADLSRLPDGSLPGFVVALAARDLASIDASSVDASRAAHRAAGRARAVAEAAVGEMTALTNEWRDRRLGIARAGGPGATHYLSSSLAHYHQLEKSAMSLTTAAAHECLDITEYAAAVSAARIDLFARLNRAIVAEVAFLGGTVPDASASVEQGPEQLPATYETGEVATTTWSPSAVALSEDTSLPSLRVANLYDSITAISDRHEAVRVMLAVIRGPTQKLLVDARCQAAAVLSTTASLVRTSADVLRARWARRIRRGGGPPPGRWALGPVVGWAAVAGVTADFSARALSAARAADTLRRDVVPVTRARAETTMRVVEEVAAQVERQLSSLRIAAVDPQQRLSPEPHLGAMMKIVAAASGRIRAFIALCEADRERTAPLLSGVTAEVAAASRALRVAVRDISTLHPSVTGALQQCESQRVLVADAVGATTALLEENMITAIGAAADAAAAADHFFSRAEALVSDAVQRTVLPFVLTCDDAVAVIASPLRDSIIECRASLGSAMERLINAEEAARPAIDDCDAAVATAISDIREAIPPPARSFCDSAVPLVPRWAEAVVVEHAHAAATVLAGSALAHRLAAGLMDRLQRTREALATAYVATAVSSQAAAVSAAVQGFSTSQPRSGVAGQSSLGTINSSAAVESALAAADEAAAGVRHADLPVHKSSSTAIPKLSVNIGTTLSTLASAVDETTAEWDVLRHAIVAAAPYPAPLPASVLSTAPGGRPGGPAAAATANDEPFPPDPSWQTRRLAGDPLALLAERLAPGVFDGLYGRLPRDILHEALNASRLSFAAAATHAVATAATAVFQAAATASANPTTDRPPHVSAEELRAHVRPALLRDGNMDMPPCYAHVPAARRSVAVVVAAGGGAFRVNVFRSAVQDIATMQSTADNMDTSSLATLQTQWRVLHAAMGGSLLLANTDGSEPPPQAVVAAIPPQATPLGWLAGFDAMRARYHAAVDVTIDVAASVLRTAVERSVAGARDVVAAWRRRAATAVPSAMAPIAPYDEGKLSVASSTVVAAVAADTELLDSAVAACNERAEAAWTARAAVDTAAWRLARAARVWIRDTAALEGATPAAASHIAALVEPRSVVFAEVAHALMALDSVASSVVMAAAEQRQAVLDPSLWAGRDVAACAACDAAAHAAAGALPPGRAAAMMFDAVCQMAAVAREASHASADLCSTDAASLRQRAEVVVDASTRVGAALDAVAAGRLLAELAVAPHVALLSALELSESAFVDRVRMTMVDMDAARRSAATAQRIREAADEEVLRRLARDRDAVVRAAGAPQQDADPPALTPKDLRDLRRRTDAVVQGHAMMADIAVRHYAMMASASERVIQAAAAVWSRHRAAIRVAGAVGTGMLRTLEPRCDRAAKEAVELASAHARHSQRVARRAAAWLAATRAAIRAASTTDGPAEVSEVGVFAPLPPTDTIGDEDSGLAKWTRMLHTSPAFTDPDVSPDGTDPSDSPALVFLSFIPTSAAAGMSNYPFVASIVPSFSFAGGALRPLGALRRAVGLNAFASQPHPPTQSSFERGASDMGRKPVTVFGSAARAIPELPLAVCRVRHANATAATLVDVAAVSTSCEGILRSMGSLRRLAAITALHSVAAALRPPSQSVPGVSGVPGLMRRGMPPLRATDAETLAEKHAAYATALASSAAPTSRGGAWYVVAGEGDAAALRNQNLSEDATSIAIAAVADNASRAAQSLKDAAVIAERSVLDGGAPHTPHNQSSGDLARGRGDLPSPSAHTGLVTKMRSSLAPQLSVPDVGAVFPRSAVWPTGTDRSLFSRDGKQGAAPQGVSGTRLPPSVISAPRNVVGHVTGIVRRPAELLSTGKSSRPSGPSAALEVGVTRALLCVSRDALASGVARRTAQTVLSALSKPDQRGLLPPDASWGTAGLFTPAETAVITSSAIAIQRVWRGHAARLHVAQNFPFASKALPALASCLSGRGPRRRPTGGSSYPMSPDHGRPTRGEVTGRLNAELALHQELVRAHMRMTGLWPHSRSAAASAAAAHTSGSRPHGPPSLQTSPSQPSRSDVERTVWERRDGRVTLGWMDASGRPPDAPSPLEPESSGTARRKVPLDAMETRALAAAISTSPFAAYVPHAGILPSSRSGLSLPTAVPTLGISPFAGNVHPLPSESSLGAPRWKVVPPNDRVTSMRPVAGHSTHSTSPFQSLPPFALNTPPATTQRSPTWMSGTDSRPAGLGSALPPLR
eukprot:TRINITY_DN2229_c0_g1_i1.p1 TRINITY_DN2229_c0_g1~~TRINITY_DN2229_c0_g1_i1.p1  ORF type:complete len:4358 (+),score=465.97 TRINITY_DN2229_c0_g1_i1:97-13170(+)